MVQATWEKPKNKSSLPSTGREHLKFILAGVVLLGAVVYLLVSGTLAGARYFLTVEEVVSNPDYLGESVRISGAVLGETIEYDSANLILEFTIVHIPSEFDDLAETLHQAVSDPSAIRLQIHMENEPMPDLLQHEAQAILTGVLEITDEGDFVFNATELLLKCPSRYEEVAPGQVAVEEE